jgi:Flp pilus assembly pilin Flp
MALSPVLSRGDRGASRRRGEARRQALDRCARRAYPIAAGEDQAMRAFIAAIVAIVVIAAGAALVLQQVQQPVAVAFTGSGAHPDAVD